MTWTYAITTGRMTHPDGGNFLGYSGAGHTLREGRDNPAMQAVVKKGPIPVGVYDIGAPQASPHTGPYTMDLTPRPQTDTHGRDLFRIHGNNAQNDASEGCIILPPDARHAIWANGDHELTVVV